MTDDPTDRPTDRPDRSDLEAQLERFVGTRAYHRTGRRTVATDGARFLAERAGAFWLLDIVDSAASAIGEEFAVLELAVDPETRRARVLIHNGHGPGDPRYRVFHRQELDWTDFPLPSFRLFVQHRVIMLPSEY